MTEPMFYELLVTVGAISIAATVGRVVTAYLRRVPAKDPAAVKMLEQLSRQLEGLRETVEATAIEVERIGEAQRFTTRLLSDRPRLSDPPRVGGRVDTPH